MTEPRIPFAQVDSFAERPFTGNPAAVCLLMERREDDWLQGVAAEMNLSETAFLTPISETDEDEYGLRWFTPETEVDLCGHATLASAHVLWEAGHVSPGRPIRFDTRSGPLVCELREAEEGALVWMDFPAKVAADLSPEDAASLAPAVTEALRTDAVRLARNQFDLLVELPTEAAVRELRPDLARLASIAVRGVIVTAPAEEPDAGYDFVSRFFGPQVGVPEDPVTGSAHCCLAPWWAPRLGRDRLTGYQASRRGGTVHMELAGDRVHLGGRAVTVLTGELLA